MFKKRSITCFSSMGEWDFLVDKCFTFIVFSKRFTQLKNRPFTRISYLLFFKYWEIYFIVQIFSSFLCSFLNLISTKNKCPVFSPKSTLSNKRLISHQVSILFFYITSREWSNPRTAILIIPIKFENCRYDSSIGIGFWSSSSLSL